MAVLNISWAHWTSETTRFPLLCRCLLGQCRLNLPGACSLLSWFTPQRADFFQAGAAPSCASPCGMQCPRPAGAPRCCGPRDNFGIVISGGNSSLSKTSVEVWPLASLPWGQGFQQCSGLASRFPTKWDDRMMVISKPTWENPLRF